MRLLLHTCCGPCMSGVYPVLSSENINITGYFYNPNIHPSEEFSKRIAALKDYTKAKNIGLVIDESYGQDLFDKEVIGQAGDRCENCYKLRLGETAKYASKNGFDSFSTTILISPYQKHDKVRQIGEEMAKDYGIIFYYRDFRPYYKDSVIASKQMGLYRQKHCGCYKSLEERN
jgi:epoxyqueuosine reductase